MGVCGKYIDGKDAVGKDRLIEARGFCHPRDLWFDDDRCGCLVGTAEVPESERVDNSSVGSRIVQEWQEREGYNFGGSKYELMSYKQYVVSAPHLRFPYLQRRFGLDRIARAVKMRAARGHNIVPERELVLEECVS